MIPAPSFICGLTLNLSGCFLGSTNMTFLFLLLLNSVLATQFECPDDGLFADTKQCDKYHECYKGKGKEHLCEDGLVFDNYVGRCDYPFMVDCPAGSILQPPNNRTPECPRLNGFFEHTDPLECSLYYWCINGNPNEFYCEQDLHFDLKTGSCIWPHKSQRKNCQKRVQIHSSGFICPRGPEQYAINGQRLQHTLFIDETDCQYFYVCLNGETPQRHGCPDGFVFNDILLECDHIENVPGCLPLYDDSALPEESDQASADQKINK